MNVLNILTLAKRMFHHLSLFTYSRDAKDTANTDELIIKDAADDATTISTTTMTNNKTTTTAAPLSTTTTKSSTRNKLISKNQIK